MQSRGVLYVHSAPLAVVPHVEWAITRVLGSPARMRWSAQPVDGTRRAECTWSGRPGTAAEFVVALRRWPMLRFEVTEEPSPGCDGERYMHVPGRGVFRATMSVTGDLMVTEGQLRSVLAAARGLGAGSLETAVHALDGLLGTAWDADLEPYRHAGEGATATRLTQVS
ncbi:MAG TPA: DUF3145 domain-containing protein [Micromonosporaceae bacterium]